MNLLTCDQEKTDIEVTIHWDSRIFHYTPYSIHCTAPSSLLFSPLILLWASHLTFLFLYNPWMASHLSLKEIRRWPAMFKQHLSIYRNHISIQQPCKGRGNSWRNFASHRWLRKKPQNIQTKLFSASTALKSYLYGYSCIFTKAFI